MKKQYEYDKEMQNRSIDIKRLIKYLWHCRYWVLLCAMIVGLIFGYFSNTQSLLPNMSVLSKEDIEVVQEVATMQQYYNEKIRYLNQSKLMEINPYQTYYTILQFSIDTDSTETRAVLVEIYENYIESGAISSDAIALLEGIEIEEKYLGEIITLSEVQRGGAIYAESNVPNKHTFSIQVVYTDASGCEKVADTVHATLKNYEKKLNNSFETHDKVMINRVSGEKVEYILEQKKNEQYSTLNNLRTILDNRLNKLSEEQKLYMVKGITEQIVGEEQTKIDIRHIIVGMGLGAAFLSVVLSVVYILKKTVQSPKDMENIFGQDTLGSLSRNEQEAGRIDYICENILLKCKKLLVNELCITSSDRCILEDRKVQELIKKMQLQGLKIFQETGFTTKTSALKALSNIEYVCFVEEIGKSKYQNIHRELSLCVEHDVNILGMISIE